jgi:acyl dehydratase
VRWIGFVVERGTMASVTVSITSDPIMRTKPVPVPDTVTVEVMIKPLSELDTVTVKSPLSFSWLLIAELGQ